MFVRTERLLLRPGWPEDAAALHRAIADETVVRNLARAPWPYAISDAQVFLSRDVEPLLPNCVMLKRTAGAPQLIGGIGLDRDDDGRIALGYWVARHHWGLGYATEAGRALLAAARQTLRLNTIHAGHFADNPASARVLRKLGFRPTGRIVRRRSLARSGTAAMVEHVLEAESSKSDAAMRHLEAA